MTQKHLVLNGPHKGQWHQAHGGRTVLQLIDPTPPRRVGDLADVFSPADTTYTTYALRTFGVEDGDKRDFHHFWQTQETERSAITMMDQLLDLVGDEAAPPHKWSYCPYCGVEAPREGYTMTNKDLPKRVVRSMHWRWMPGMLAIRWTGPCRGSHRYTDADVRAGVTFYRGTPDLTDPCTLGGLLALVREAWGCPDLSAVGTPEGWRINAEGVVGLRDLHSYLTEAEALVTALEAAP